MVGAQNANPPAKLKAEDVIARHVQSIGAAETLASVQSRLIFGPVEAVSRGQGVSRVNGNLAFASEGTKNLLSMTFPNPQYPFERVGFNGNKVTVAVVRPGFRTILGDFSYTYELLFKQGLMGGSLSSAWPLTNLSEHGAKVELGGKKNIDGRDAYEIKYSPRGGSDLSISLYFDATTFEHIRSVYRRTLSPTMGKTIDTSARRLETRYLLSEDFSEYKKESGLNLPHRYKLHLAISGENGAVETDWTADLTSFQFNQKIKPEEFSVEGNTK
jgi:hypothetical protein